MEEEKVIHQHFVPKIYLKAFSTKKKKNHYTYVYNKDNKKAFSRNIKKIAFEDEFYDQYIEKAFSKYENDYKNSLKSLTVNAVLIKFQLPLENTFSFRFNFFNRFF